MSPTSSLQALLSYLTYKTRRMSASSHHLKPPWSEFAISLYSLRCTSSILVVLFTCMLYLTASELHLTITLTTTTHSFHTWEQRMPIATNATVKPITILRDVRAFHACSLSGRQTHGLDHALLPFTPPALKRRLIVDIMQDVPIHLSRCSQLREITGVIMSNHTESMPNFRHLECAEVDSLQRSISSRSPSHQYFVPSTGLDEPC